MGKQTGSGAGLSGVIGIPGLNVKFPGWFLGWSVGMSGATAPVGGRGDDSEWLAVSWVFSTGTILANGTVRLDTPPMPEIWRGQRGTVRVQFHTNRYIDYPIIVLGAAFKYAKPGSNAHSVSLSVQVTGTPTLSAGWGTAITAGNADSFTKELWANTSKTLDAQDPPLADRARRYIALWGLSANDDAEEVGFIQTGLAAAAIALPFTDLKVRDATFQRAGFRCGYLTIDFGLTDHHDDVLLPLNQWTLDPNNLANQGTTAAIGASAPTLTAGGLTWSDRGTTTRYLNDGAVLNVKSWGLRDTAADIENPNTIDTIDPLGIDSSGRETQVYLTSGGAPSPAGPPSGLQIDTSQVETINSLESAKSWTYSVLNSEQRRTYPATFTIDDPSDLASQQQKAAFGAAPTLDSPYVERGTRSQPITPSKTLYIREGGLRTTAEDLTMPGTWERADPLGIDSSGQEVAVYDTAGGPPSPAGPPSGQQLVFSTEREENQLTSSIRWEYDVLNSEQRRTYPATFTYDDPSDVGSEQQKAAFGAAPTLDSPYVERGTRSQAITPSKTLYIREGGLRTRRQDLSFPGTVAELDGNDLDTRGREAIPFDFGASEPTPAAQPTNTKIVATEVERVTQLTSVKRWAYAQRDSIDARELPDTWTITDPDGIRSRASVAKVDAVPSAPSGFSSRGIRVQPLTQGLSPDHELQIMDAGLLSPAEEIEHEGTASAANILGERAVSTRVQTTVDVQTCAASDDVAELLAAAVGTLNADVSHPWLEAKAVKLNKERWVLTTFRPTDDKAWFWGEPHERRETRAVDPTGAAMRFTRVYAYGPGTVMAYAQSYDYPVTYQTGVLRRYWREDLVADKSFLSLQGTISDDAGGFGGKPQYTVSYLGSPVVRYNHTDEAGYRWLRFDYPFLYCAARSAGGSIVDANFGDSAIPRDCWIPVSDSLLSSPGSVAAASVDPSYVVNSRVYATYATSFLA